jgi:serine/threonine-protein kinase
MDERERDEWREADRLFERLIELDDGDRDAALRACAAAPDVRRKLDRLLAVSRRQHRLLDAPDGGASGGAVAGREFGGERWAGRCIAGWTLGELIGRGGMAAVYRATRSGQDFEQVAAIKLLDTALHGTATRERFRRERSILARLQHPHIAGLIDAGVDGADAYLVMALVDGVRIDDHCEAHALPMRARIELMLQVCAAVAHAHRQLIVHRDLKPANILVTAGGHAMLLDFGIARLLESDDTEGRTFTRAFTPDYAAPEQRAGDRALGTAVDVYGLGAVLHRLLAGVPPRHDAHGDPLPASACARELGRARDARVLRGDLDAILARALAADAQRRYTGVGALADDLSAWLRYRSVLARRAGAADRVRKFVRRNRAASALALTTIAAAAIGLAAFAASHRALQRRAAELQTVTAFQADMLDRIDPGAVGSRLHESLGEALQRAPDAGADAARAALAHLDYAGLAVGLLDGAVLRPAVASARGEFARQPRVEAMLLQSIAGIYRNLGRLDAAEPLQNEAVTLFRNVLGPGDPLTLAGLREQLKLVRARNPADGEQRHREVLALHERWLGADSVDTALARAALGQWLMDHGKSAPAETLLRAAVQRIERARGHADPDAVATRANLAYAISNQGRYAESEPLFRQALADATKAFGPDHAYTLTVADNLAWVLNRLDRGADAEALYRKVYEARRRTLGAEHRSTLISLNNLAVQLRRRGAVNEAEPLQRQAYAGFLATLGAQHAATLHAGLNLARVLIARNEHGEAATLLRAELDAWRARDDKQAIAAAERLLGRAFAGLHQRGPAQRALIDSWQAASALERGEEARKTAQALVDFYGEPDGDPQQRSRWSGELQRLAAERDHR